MAYGTIKVDNITFDNGGVDKLITVSGLFYSTSGALTVTGTISGGNVTAPTATFTTLTGTTTAGTTATFTSGSFTSLTGVTTTGTTATFTSGSFTSLTGVTTTVTSGIFGAGSAAAPSISFASDPNTGIYSPGADQLAISTSGVGRLFVDANGNVGIGATPNAYAGYSTLTINNTTGSELDFEVNGTLTSDIYTDSTGTYWTTRTAVPIVLRTNSAERLRITSAGLVGIGTNSPTANLHVYGTNPSLSIEGDGNSYYPQFDISGVNGKLFLTTYFGPTITAANTAGTAPLVFRVGGTAAAGAFGGSEVARITSAGLVGVGTSSPNALLHLNGGTINVQGGTASSGNGADINLIAQNAANFSNGGVVNITAGSATLGNANGGNIILTPGTQTSAGTPGYLGIGTSSPTSYVHAVDNTGAKTVNYSSALIGSNVTAAGFTSGVKTALEIQSTGSWTGTGAVNRGLFVNVSGGTNNYAAIFSGGNVGIGTTSPSKQLSVRSSLVDVGITLGAGQNSRNQDIDFLDSLDSVAGRLRYYPYSDFMSFWTNATESARIDSSGRLLVGTSSNSGGALFQVNGDRIRIGTAKTPASASATGAAGEICWDASYIYVCTATNTWKRTAIETW